MNSTAFTTTNLGYNNMAMCLLGLLSPVPTLRVNDTSEIIKKITENSRLTKFTINGLVFDKDGEFWMTMKDFMTNWHKVEICHIGPEEATDVAAVSDSSAGGCKHWQAQTFDGSWTKGATAGGCRNFLDKPPKTFSYNPQYRVTLTDCDDDVSSGKGWKFGTKTDKLYQIPAIQNGRYKDDRCTCVIALMQKNRRRIKSNTGGADLLTIGYAVFKLDDDQVNDNRPLAAQYFRTHVSVARSHAFINIREVCCRFTLPPGNYLIVPSTFEPHEEGEFMLRVFSEKAVHAQEADSKIGYTPPAPPPRPSPLMPAAPTAESDVANDRLDKFFEKLAGDDLEIDAWELQKILSYALKKEFTFDKFCIDTCRSMIACVDLSRTGKLDLGEFKELWGIIRVWKAAFLRHDKDASGSISSYELGTVLGEVGYNLPTRVLRCLVLRYASQDGFISFDSYIGCAVRLKTMMDIYEERDPRHMGSASFSMDAWIELTMYA